MTRFHATDKGNIPFTAEEELEWDAMEAAAIEAKPAREKARAADAVKAQMAAADLSIIRALVEGDKQRIATHAAEQEKRRAKLK